MAVGEETPLLPHADARSRLAVSESATHQGRDRTSDYPLIPSFWEQSGDAGAADRDGVRRRWLYPGVLVSGLAVVAFSLGYASLSGGVTPAKQASLGDLSVVPGESVVPGGGVITGKSELQRRQNNEDRLRLAQDGGVAASGANTWTGQQQQQQRQKQQQQQDLRAASGPRTRNEKHNSGHQAQPAGGWRSGLAGSSVGVSGAVGHGAQGIGAAIEDDVSGTDGASRSTSKPNVFFFLLDDLGFGDIGYQSTDLKDFTPNLDALAENGIKLSQYYSMSLCTPARASLMTGRYPVRLGMQYSVIAAGAPWGLPTREKIFPQYMNDAGYESHMVGKWHLGSHNDDVLPSQRGFKTYMGYLNGEDNYWSHKNVEASLDGKQFYDFGFGNATNYYDISRETQHFPCRTEAMSSLDKDATVPQYFDDLFSAEPVEGCYTGVYSTDAFIGRAKKVVSTKTPWDEEPLFLYVAHQSVHAPLGPAPTEGLTDENREKLAQLESVTTYPNRATFAGVLMYVDQKIGEFVDTLEAGGWLENSIIAFASDNGGCPSDGGINYPLRGCKQSQFEGGTRVPAFVYSRSHLPQAVWGTDYDKIMHVSDWLPTLATAAGAELHGSAGRLDGVSHWESFLAGATERGEGGAAIADPRTELLYNWDSYLLNSADGLREDFGRTQGAFRQGKWKLLVNVWCSPWFTHDPVVLAADPLLDAETLCGSQKACQDCCDFCQTDTSYLVGDALYNLEDDPREAHNLIDELPEVADRLRKRAVEVAFSEWSSSNYLDVDETSYEIWATRGWWLSPWVSTVSVDTRGRDTR